MMASSSEPFSVIDEEERSTSDLHHHHHQYQQQMMHEQIISSSSISNPRTNKYNQIRQCLTRDDASVALDQVQTVPTAMSLWELRELALTRGGLVNDELRQQVWPSLVGFREGEPWMEQTAKLFEPSSSSCATITTTAQQQEQVVCSEMEDRERDLIRRDVGRSVLFHHSCPSPNSVMGSFDTNSSASSATAADKFDGAASVKSSSAEHTTSTLAAVLTCTISTPLTPATEKPHYYQGLHDIGGVLLHNLDYNEVMTTAILRQLCQSHLRDCVKENFADLQWFLDAVLLQVVEQCDVQVHEALLLSGVPLLSTVLPWLLTWFTHSMHDEEGASRLVDAFMASHPLLPFYVSIALLVHPVLRDDIVSCELDDPSSMHFAIQNLPSRIQSDWAHGKGDLYVTAQELIETAISIMEKVPPQSLLQLVEAPERAERMGLMKSLSLWTLDGESSTFTTCCPRAKMASGVPVLMKTQQREDVISWRKPFGPPAVAIPDVPPPQQQVIKRSVFQVYKRRVRNTIRSIRRRLPKSKWALFAIFYFTCVIIYGIYDWIHYMCAFYMAQLFRMAH